MSDATQDIAFGVATIATDAGPSTAVVIGDAVMPLKTIVGRHSTPGAVAPGMRLLMADWPRWHDWLRGLDLDPQRDEGWSPAATVRFLAPSHEPVNIFHTYHNYDRPSSSSGLYGPSKAERVLPDLFLGSSSALAGHRAVVAREQGGVQFDFELELTAVIGRTADRVRAEHADAYVAGYTIANDLTMHHGWWRDIRAGSRLNDNIRMKNFPGYTPMGPAIVPSDLVGDPANLSLRVSVDGQLRQDSSTAKMLWSVNELIEYLSWIMPLQPGDLILTGSAEELPRPEGQKRGIGIGQSVTCQIARLGRLENRIEEQGFAQPNAPKMLDA